MIIRVHHTLFMLSGVEATKSQSHNLKWLKNYSFNPLFYQRDIKIY